MKKKVILYIAMSLDGFIARKDGSVDWLSPYENSGEDYGYKRFYDSVGTVIMGNTTYKEAQSFGESYKGKNCFVFSRKRHKEKKSNVIFINGDVKKCMEDLNLKDDKDIWLVGGASIIDQFLKYDLIDEFIISIIPALLGDGIPLFKGGTVESQLRLLNIKSYDSGLVQGQYERKRQEK